MVGSELTIFSNIIRAFTNISLADYYTSIREFIRVSTLPPPPPQVAVDGGGTPVGLVSQGADLLVVILGELQADCSGEATQEQHGEEAGPLLTRVD